MYIAIQPLLRMDISQYNIAAVRFLHKLVCNNVHCKQESTEANAYV